MLWDPWCGICGVGPVLNGPWYGPRVERPVVETRDVEHMLRRLWCGARGVEPMVLGLQGRTVLFGSSVRPVVSEEDAAY